MTSSHPICIILDLLGPILFILYNISGYIQKRIYGSFILASFWGVLIGCTWEIPFGILGNKFLITPNNPLGFGIHIIHSFWDSIIFMIGLYLFHIRNTLCLWNFKKILYFTLFGLGIEVLVEFMFNGNYWTYNTHQSYNPVLFKINGIGYTLLPYLTWIISPPIYLYGIYYIEKYFGKVKIGLNTKPKVQLLQLDDDSTEIFNI